MDPTSGPAGEHAPRPLSPARGSSTAHDMEPTTAARDTIEQHAEAGPSTSHGMRHDDGSSSNDTSDTHGDSSSFSAGLSVRLPLRLDLTCKRFEKKYSPDDRSIMMMIQTRHLEVFLGECA